MPSVVGAVLWAMAVAIAAGGFCAFFVLNPSSLLEICARLPNENIVLDR
jgi:hypothetical protein